MSASLIFDSLKLHLKARGLTYADVARALKISEATVKRIFATRNCSLARLEELCDLVQVDVAELARSAPRLSRLINRLSLEQESELVSDPALFLVAVSVMNLMRFEDIVDTYRLEEAQVLSLLLRLERIGFLDLHENNRIRLQVSRAFAWIPDGPIMRYFKSQAQDFFNHAFDGPGELMRTVNVRISHEARVAMVSRLEQIAREYSEQHNADSRLPPEERPPLSVCLAARYWEPDLFKAFRRGGTETGISAGEGG